VAAEAELDDGEDEGDTQEGEGDDGREAHFGICELAALVL
jgi:hypothetical protein